jgi:peptidoglycan/xylan/chitin deacetylase (PgdA/CDA1 family)
MALEQAGVPFEDWRPGASRGRFVLFDGRTGRPPALSAGQTALDIGDLALAAERLLDESAAPHTWTVGALTLREHMSKVARRQVRTAILSMLQQAIEQAGGVWAAVSPYPFPFQSAFNLRADHDEWQPDDLAAFLASVEGWEHAVSHYVCGSAFERRLEGLAALKGFHVGSHGYWHHTYADLRQNHANIARGIDVLRRAGLNPVGFVAPHGRFHRNLLEAVERLGITHSSEFSLAWDELPFFPAGSNVLQIPVHPVCLGLFLEAVRDQPDHARTAAADEAATYFRSEVVRKHRRGEPIFLYCHPDGRWGRYPGVVRAILESVAELPFVWPTSLAEFERWWRERLKARIEVHSDGDDLAVVVRSRPAGYPLGVEIWRQARVAVVPAEEPVTWIRLGSLAWQNRGSKDGVLPVRVDGPHGLRQRIAQFLDWERATPISEIDASTVRGWMKRTLRQIRRQGPE